AEIYVFYIDIRSPGRLEDFYQNLQDVENINFRRGKVAKIEDTGSGNLTVTAENTLTGNMMEETVDMVVLATGLVPSTKDTDFAVKVTTDEFGFIPSGVDANTGFIAAGTATRPLEVSAVIQEATGTPLQALKAIARR
ncbi:heterodisulfide reductase subunit A, partial [candidate division KSB1 bacterium]